MKFNKKLLAIMVAGTTAAAGMQAAQAVHRVAPFGINDGATSSGRLYAGETAVPGSGIVIVDDINGFTTDTNTGNQLVTGQLDINGVLSANAIPANTDIRVTLTLSQGTFVAAPAMGNIGDASAPTTNVQSFTVLQGGAGSSFVTFAGNTGANGFAAGSRYMIDVTNLNTPNQTTITIDPIVLAADNFGATTLTNDPAESYVGFRRTITTATTANTASTAGPNNFIDVTQNSLFFSGSSGDRNATPGTTTIALQGAGVATMNNSNVTNSAPVTAFSTIVTGFTFTVNADNGLAAFNQTGGSVVVGPATATIATGNLSATTGNVTMDGTNTITGNTTLSFATVVTVPAANTVTIDETGLTINSDATAVNAGFAKTNSGFETAATGTLGSLTRNGSSARLTFALSPDLSQFGNQRIRITNPSAIGGDVRITLTNDDGTAFGPVGLGTITGGSDTLAAGGSTGFLTLQSLIDATSATAGGTSPNFRVDINAGFGANGTASGVVVNSYVINGTALRVLSNSALRTN